MWLSKTSLIRTGTFEVILIVCTRLLSSGTTGRPGIWIFSNSDVGSFTSHKDKSMKVLWDGTYGFSSSPKKTRKSKHLQMSLQRQHFLLSKTLSVGLAEVWTRNLPVWNFCCWVADIPPCETSPSDNERGEMHNVYFRRLAGNWTVKIFEWVTKTLEKEKAHTCF